MCFRPQRGAFSGVVHAYTVASKNRSLTTVRSVCAYFAGRHSTPDLHDTKLTEGERLVRHLWHYMRFSVGNTSKTGTACSV